MRSLIRRQTMFDSMICRSGKYPKRVAYAARPVQQKDALPKLAVSNDGTFLDYHIVSAKLSGVLIQFKKLDRQTGWSADFLLQLMPQAL